MTNRGVILSESISTNARNRERVHGPHKATNEYCNHRDSFTGGWKRIPDVSAHLPSMSVLLVIWRWPDFASSVYHWPWVNCTTNVPCYCFFVRPTLGGVVGTRGTYHKESQIIGRLSRDCSSHSKMRKRVGDLQGIGLGLWAFVEKDDSKPNSREIPETTG